MLFLALLGKSKGLAEVQTAKPDLSITPPPKTDNLDPVISLDVFEEMERKGFAGRVQGVNDGSRSRSLHQRMQATSPSVDLYLILKNQVVKINFNELHF